MSTLSRFLQPKTKIFRRTMKLYKGQRVWETVTKVYISGQMSNGRKTFTFDGCDLESIYMMFRDEFNGEYLMAI